MVVLVDLSEEDIDPASPTASARHGDQQWSFSRQQLEYDSVEGTDELVNLNGDSLFAASLSCYPYVKSMAGLYDLSTSCQS